MIDLGRGMIFPNRYDADQPDGPDPCEECHGEGILHGGEPDCDYPYGTAAVDCHWCDGTGEQR